MFADKHHGQIRTSIKGEGVISKHWQKIAVYIRCLSYIHIIYKYMCHIYKYTYIIHYIYIWSPPPTTPQCVICIVIYSIKCVFLVFHIYTCICIYILQYIWFDDFTHIFILNPTGLTCPTDVPNVAQRGIRFWMMLSQNLAVAWGVDEFLDATFSGLRNLGVRVQVLITIKININMNMYSC